MAILRFLVAIAILAFIGGIALIAANTARGREKRGGILLAVVAGIVALLLVPLNAGLVLVQPDEIGVVFRQTGSGEAALREPLDSGLKWVVPFIDEVIRYPTSQQSVTMANVAEGGEATSGPVNAISSDGQAIIVDITVIYRLDSTLINTIHRDWRDTYETGYIVPQTRSTVRNAISEYGAEEIYSGGRAALEVEINDTLGERLAREGFILTDVLIRNISFSPEFTDAIEKKQIAEQEAQRAVFLVQQAEQEAEQARVQAKGEADSAVIAARGEADAILIRAEAESEGLKLINEVLAQNPNLIQWQYINELGDQVELIIIPSNTPFLFDLEQLAQQNGAESQTFTVPPDTEGQ